MNCETGPDIFESYLFSRHDIIPRDSLVVPRMSVIQPAAHLAAIVESSDDAIVGKDLNGTILSWNAAAQRLFGYTPHEAVGQNIRFLMLPERLAEEDYVLEQVRKGVGVRHFETVRRRKDGTLVEVSLTVSPVRDNDGV